MKNEAELNDMRTRLQELRDDTRADYIVGGAGGSVDADLNYMRAQHRLQKAESDYYEALRQVAVSEVEAE